MKYVGKTSTRVNTFSIRKYSVGVASIMIGLSIVSSPDTLANESTVEEDKDVEILEDTNDPEVTADEADTTSAPDTYEEDEKTEEAPEVVEEPEVVSAQDDEDDVLRAEKDSLIVIINDLEYLTQDEVASYLERIESSQSLDELNTVQTEAEETDERNRQASLESADEPSDEASPESAELAVEAAEDESSDPEDEVNTEDDTPIQEQDVEVEFSRIMSELQSSNERTESDLQSLVNVLNQMEPERMIQAADELIDAGLVEVVQEDDETFSLTMTSGQYDDPVNSEGRRLSQVYPLDQEPLDAEGKFIKKDGNFTSLYNVKLVAIGEIDRNKSNWSLRFHYDVTAANNPDRAMFFQQQHYTSGTANAGVLQWRTGFGTAKDMRDVEFVLRPGPGEDGRNWVFGRTATGALDFEIQPERLFNAINGNTPYQRRVSLENGNVTHQLKTDEFGEYVVVRIKQINAGEHLQTRMSGRALSGNAFDNQSYVGDARITAWLSINENVNPLVGNGTVNVGETLTLSPSFTDNNGNPIATPQPRAGQSRVDEAGNPIPTLFQFGDGDIPDFVTIDELTGAITVSPNQSPNTTFTLPIVVTYPDGTQEIVYSEITVVDYVSPVGQNQTVSIGSTPSATDSLGNANELPANVTVDWLTPPDTSTSGDKSATIIVTYPNGETRTADVVVTVEPTDAEKYIPNGIDQTVEVGVTPNVLDSVINIDELPEGTIFEWVEVPNTSEAGDVPATINVIYPDGSSETVDVIVRVVELPTFADNFEPVGQNQTVNIGVTPDPELSLVNLNELPEGTVVEWEVVPDTSSAGDVDAVLIVTYPDGSVDTVAVVVTVVDVPDQGDSYTPYGRDQTVFVGDQPIAADSILNIDDLPSGTTYEWQTSPDTSTSGTVSGTIIVTYPDGSVEEVTVNVRVVDRPDNDETPVGRDQTVQVGAEVNPRDSIINADDLPEGTTFEWVEAPDTSSAGERDVIVRVIYPDGTIDEVEVDVRVIVVDVTQPVYTPIGQNQSVRINENPIAVDSIINADRLPEGTTYEWLTQPDTSSAGDVPAVVVITYPNGTTENVDVTITVVDVPVGALPPVGQDQTVRVGDSVDARDSILNADDLPEGTTFEWAVVPDTSSPGTIDAIVIVTYPDGTVESVEVNVQVVVVALPNNADTYTPVPQVQIVQVNDSPNAIVSIINSDRLPEGTTFEWETAPDTSSAGEVEAVVRVTYPDGSSELVNVTVRVLDPLELVDSYTPVGLNQKVRVGDVPDAADSIANRTDLPEGTTFEWVEVPDTSAVGDVNATVRVTYPDGSSETVDVVVTVVSPEASINLIGVEQSVYVGQVPNVNDSVFNADELPEGTTFEWLEVPDTSVPGRVTGVIVVTRPDNTEYQVEVTIVVLPLTPTTVEQTVVVGETPNAEESIGNLDDLPEGTTVEWVITPDTSAPGEVPGRVVVTYPDGSSVELDVTVIVIEIPTPDIPVHPIGQEQTVRIGEYPDPRNSIENADDFPEGTVFEWIEDVDTSTPGRKTGIVLITYPNGSQEVIEVVVNVIDELLPPIDPVTPIGQEQTVGVGEVPDPRDSLENVGELPEGTIVEWEALPDTSTPGRVPGVVVITYPDGTVVTVEVVVVVVDGEVTPPAEPVAPIGQEQTVGVGEVPDPRDSLENVGELPEGTIVEWETVPDTSAPGRVPGVVVITYPDGTVVTVEVVVVVVDGEVTPPVDPVTPPVTPTPPVDGDDKVSPPSQDTGQDVLPQTGIEKNAMIGLASSILLALGGFMIFSRRREKDVR